MTREELAEKLKENQDYYLEVIATSNPDYHMRLLQKYGLNVGNSVREITRGYKTLEHNRDYLKEFLEAPILEHKLPKGYYEVLKEQELVKTTPNVNRAVGDSTTAEKSEGNGYAIVAELLGGLLKGVVGKKEKAEPVVTQEKEKNNNVWYALGGILALVLIFVAYLIFKKK